MENDVILGDYHYEPSELKLPPLWLSRIDYNNHHYDFVPAGSKAGLEALPGNYPEKSALYYVLFYVYMLTKLKRGVFLINNTVPFNPLWGDKGANNWHYHLRTDQSSRPMGGFELSYRLPSGAIKVEHSQRMEPDEAIEFLFAQYCYYQNKKMNESIIDDDFVWYSKLPKIFGEPDFKRWDKTLQKVIPINAVAASDLKNTFSNIAAEFESDDKNFFDPTSRISCHDAIDKKVKKKDILKPITDLFNMKNIAPLALVAAALLLFGRSGDDK